MRNRTEYAGALDVNDSFASASTSRSSRNFSLEAIGSGAAAGEPHHFAAVIDGRRAAAARESVEEKRATAAADLDEGVIAREREPLKNRQEVRTVVERVAIRGARQRARWPPRMPVGVPVAEAGRRDRAHQRRDNGTREPSGRLAGVAEQRAEPAVLEDDARASRARLEPQFEFRDLLRLPGRRTPLEAHA